MQPVSDQINTCFRQFNDAKYSIIWYKDSVAEKHTDSETKIQVRSQGIVKWQYQKKIIAMFNGKT